MLGTRRCIVLHSLADRFVSCVRFEYKDGGSSVALPVTQPWNSCALLKLVQGILQCHKHAFNNQLININQYKNL